jgi:two-component system, cell cycle sensor histidine kinase PleC
MSETHEAALLAAAPSAQRRPSSQRMREARDRLTTTSGSRAVFD